MQAYAEEIALNEMAHVKFLKTVLGGKAPACPQLDICKAFADAANAALSTKLSPRWNPYSYDQTFLLGAFIFEDGGVTAYNGATPLFTSKVFTGAAASILTIEAYHAGMSMSCMCDEISSLSSVMSSTLKPGCIEKCS